MGLSLFSDKQESVNLIVDDWFGYVNNPIVGIFFICGSLKSLAEEMGDRKERKWMKQRRLEETQNFLRIIPF